jgi:hypothetical protein
MSRTTAIAFDTRCVAVPLRCVYCDIDRVLRDGLRDLALEACRRADVEVVALAAGGREAEAAFLGITSWIDDDGLVFRGERQPGDDPVAAHMAARGVAPEECLQISEGSFYEAVIGDIMRRRSP